MQVKVSLCSLRHNFNMKYKNIKLLKLFKKNQLIKKCDVDSLHFFYVLSEPQCSVISVKVWTVYAHLYPHSTAVL